MYFPKSQITPNLYTNGGEFIYASNSKPYAGYYFKTSTGKYFTGRNQDDRPNELLNPITNQANQINNTANPNPQTSIALPFEGAFPQNANVSNDAIIPDYSEELVIEYLNIKQISLNDLPSFIVPTYNPVLPTQQDYQNGEFRRYFCKKTNEIIYIEISQETFDKLVAKDSQVLWQLYKPFFLTWQLTGNVTQVARVNKNSIELTSFRNKLPRLEEYLRFDYTKYYNQLGNTTSGSYINGVNQGYVLDNRNGRSTRVSNSQNDSGSIR
jgi:hypothetical protein